MVAEDTDLWGLIRAMNKFLESWGLSGEVTDLYYLSVSTGQSSKLWGKDGKKNSVSGFPCLDCFANAAGRITTSSGLNYQWLSCKEAKYAKQDGLVKANNIASLKERDLSDRRSNVQCRRSNVL